MFRFFYFFTKIYTSTNFESIVTKEFFISNMKNFYEAKNKSQCNQISSNTNNTKKFLEQENFELEKIIENVLDLEEELGYKNMQSSDSNNPIFDTMNFQYFKNNETFESPVRKKLKLDNNNECITSENSRHWQQNFQNNASIYNSNPSKCLELQKQYDTVINFYKTINNQNDFKKPEVKLTNFNLFLDFYKDVLTHFKSAFDKAKKQPILISKKAFLFGSKNEKIIFKLSNLKRVYYYRRINFNNSIQCQIKNIEKSSFIIESSCESIKELIIEYNMFVKEVVKYFLVFSLSVSLKYNNINFIYNECEDIIQRLTNISKIVKFECIAAIIKILIERYEGSYDFLKRKRSNFFKSATYLSTDIN